MNARLRNEPGAVFPPQTMLKSGSFSLLEERRHPLDLSGLFLRPSRRPAALSSMELDGLHMASLATRDRLLAVSAKINKGDTNFWVWMCVGVFWFQRNGVNEPVLGLYVCGGLLVSKEWCE